jgi:hypothetical protein
MHTLDTIAKFYGTDKSSEIHNYCEKYEKYFKFNRHDIIKILEIGVYQGKSLLTWSDYFPNSTIIGLDIDPNCKQFQNEDKNIWIEIGSQNDYSFLKHIKEKWGKFDLIIDDGSHNNNDVIFSFTNLIDSINRSGMYVIEDTSCSYWQQYGGGYRKVGTVIEFFKNLVDDINFNGESLKNKEPYYARKETDLILQTIRENKNNIRLDLESITFLNGLILITKR